jgi:hypothetical protein
MSESNCPHCGTAVQPTQRTCFACGSVLAERAPTPDASPFNTTSTPAGSSLGELKALHEKQGHRRKIHSGRGAILAVAILTFLGGIVMFFLGQAEVDKQIAQVEQQIAPFAPEQRAVFEQKIREASGMSWEQAAASDRGRVKMLLATNLGLSVLYVGLWVWAKKNALGAALVALAVYATVIVGSAIFDPRTMAQGLLVKIAIVSALISAVSSAYKFRRLEPGIAA